MSRTPPGLMFGPAWRAEPSYIVSEALGKGPGVPSSSDTSGIPDTPQGRQLGPLQVGDRRQCTGTVGCNQGSGH